MNPNLRWKAIIIFGLILICAVGLLCFHKGVDGGSKFAVPTSLEDLRTNLENRISLGLDLRGGMHLILQVQVNEAINTETDQVVQRLSPLLREQGIEFQSVRKSDPTHVQ